MDLWLPSTLLFSTYAQKNWWLFCNIMENNWSTSVCHSIRNVECAPKGPPSAHNSCSTHEDFNSEVTLPYSYLYVYEASLDSHSQAPTSSSNLGVKRQPLKWCLHPSCISHFPIPDKVLILPADTSLLQGASQVMFMIVTEKQKTMFWAGRNMVQQM